MEDTAIYFGKDEIKIMESIYSTYKKHKTTFWITIIVFLVILIGVPFLLTRTWCDKLPKFSDTGQIGDTLGGITSPFIGFVNVILLIVTLLRQIEFNDKQLESQKKEQFKSSFFQMVQTQRELLHEVKGTFFFRHMRNANVKNGMVWGVEYFQIAGEELNSIFSVLENRKNLGDWNINNIKTKYALNEVLTEYTDAPNRRKMEIAYDKFFVQHQELGNYFRHLYHILKFINDEEQEMLSQVTESDQKEHIKEWFKNYADMLQATLSADELLIAYYNSASFPNARDLFKKYRFVENLTKEKLFDRERDVMEGFEFIKETY